MADWEHVPISREDAIKRKAEVLKEDILEHAADLEDLETKDAQLETAATLRSNAEKESDQLRENCVQYAQDDTARKAQQHIAEEAVTAFENEVNRLLAEHAKKAQHAEMTEHAKKAET